MDVFAFLRGSPNERPLGQRIGAARRGLSLWGLAHAPVLVIILLSLFMVAPLLHPLYFWGAHDARHSVYFLVEFDRSIQDGILYPRWAPDFTFGYGYPIFNIYAPLAYYLGEIFHLLGLGFVESVKVVFGLGIVLSGLSMYLLARDFFGTRGGVLAAVVYIYVPYRIVDVYVRGALSESLAFVFFPLILWAFRRLVVTRKAKHMMAGALSLAGLILTHNGIALLFLPLLAAFCLWTILAENRGSPRGIAVSGAWLLASGILALGLSAIFWLPMVVENQYVRTDQWTTAYYDYRSHFVYLFQLFSPRWGYGISQVGPADDMPLQLGVVPVTLALLGLWLTLTAKPEPKEAGVAEGEDAGISAWLENGEGNPHPNPLPLRRAREQDDLRRAREQDDLRRARGQDDLRKEGEQDGGGVRSPRSATIFFLVATAVTIFLMLPMSLGIWEALRIAVFVQFPWRLLALTTVSLSFLSGAVAIGFRQGLASIAGLVAIMVAVVLGSYSYLSPQFIEPAEGPVSLGGLMRFQQSSGELVGLTKWNQEKPKDSPLMPLYLAGQPITSKVAPDSLPPGALAETIRRTTVLDEVKVQLPSETQLVFYTQAYPGWRAYVDGKPAKTEAIGKYGLISVAVPAGEHTVLLRFEPTLPRVLGTLLSLVFLAGLSLWGLWSLFREKARR